MLQPNTKHILCVSTLLLGLTASTSNGFAQQQEPEQKQFIHKTKGWAGGSVTGKNLTSKDFIPSPQQQEAYIERYVFSLGMDGGGHIGGDFTVSNLGWGSRHGVARVRIYLPNQDKYHYSKKVDEKGWSYEKDKFSISMADMKIYSTGKDTFSVEFDNPTDKIKMKLDFTNLIPMWRPGRGRIDVNGGHVKYQMLAPRARVKGTVKVGNKVHNILSSGDAWADHSNSNVAPYDYAKRFSRFRTFNKNLTVAWREIKLDGKHGDRSYTWVMVGYKNKIVYSDAGANIRFGKVTRDTTTGYSLPYAVQVDSKSGKDNFKIILQGQRMKKQDLLETYGAVVKTIASAVSKPFRYDFWGKYTLQMTIKGATATIKGKGRYTVDYVNL